MKPATLLLPLAAQLLIAGCAPAGRRTTVPPAGDPHADHIASNLLPAVRVVGRTYLPATIAQRLSEYHVPAVSVAVIEDGRIAWARAWGMADVATGTAATPTTLFQAASMSKAVASSAALQLVQERTLALDEPVNEKLRSWRIPDNAFTRDHPVTLRELLTHTAGLTVSGFPGYAADAQLPTVIQVLDGAPPANTPAVLVDTTPGTRFSYSGGGITVMQLLLTDVTGKPFPVLMRDRVLHRAGMSVSTYEQPLPASRAAEAATGYQTGGAPIEGRYHTYPEMAAAGLWTTPSDLARWILVIQRSLAADKDALLSRTMATAMMTRGVGPWGLGVELIGAGDSLAFTHGAGNAGFRGQLAGFVGTRRGVVVMTNSDAGSRLVDEIIGAVAREYGWPGFAPRTIRPVATTAEGLRAYAGTYATQGGTQVRVTAEGTALWLILPWGERRELVPTGDEHVESPEGGSGRFIRAADGRVVAVVLGDDRLERVP